MCTPVQFSSIFRTRSLLSIHPFVPWSIDPTIYPWVFFFTRSFVRCSLLSLPVLLKLRLKTSPSRILNCQPIKTDVNPRRCFSNLICRKLLFSGRKLNGLCRRQRHSTLGAGGFFPSEGAIVSGEAAIEILAGRESFFFSLSPGSQSQCPLTIAASLWKKNPLGPKVKALKRLKVTKALSFREGNRKINKEFAVTRELFR